MENELTLEKKANAFRSAQGLGSDDPIRLKSFLTKLNVLTLFKPLSADFSGMAIKISPTTNSHLRFILVNSNHSLGKQHFTLCHELYHLFIQESFTARTCSTGLFNKKLDREEYHADVFAAYLLLPEGGVKSLIPDQELSKNKITLKTLLKIEQYYSCSRSALLYRLKNFKLIDDNKYEEFKGSVKRNALLHGFSTELYESGNADHFIGDYGSVAKELLDRGSISETHFLNLLMDLGFDEDNLENIFNDEA